MQKFNKIFFSLICLVLFFSIQGKALAADSCLCSSDLDAIGDTAVYKKQTQLLKAQCIVTAAKNCKIDSQSKITAKKLSPVCGVVDSAKCEDSVKEWNQKLETMVASGKKNVESSAAEVATGDSALSTLIKKCGLYPMPEECWDVTVFVSALLQITNYLFGIIGSLALGVFVYGGFVIILSQGNPEKVKQGSGAMINAVIGLLIAFGGYVLVSFLGEILHLKAGFGLLK